MTQLEADSSAVDGLRDGIKGIDDAIDKVQGEGSIGRWRTPFPGVCGAGVAICVFHASRRWLLACGLPA